MTSFLKFVLYSDFLSLKYCYMKLKEKKNILLNSIMENCQDIITVKDLDFNYLVCNRAFLKLLNFSHETNVLGKNIKEILYPETYETIVENINDVLLNREPKVYTFNVICNSKVHVLSQLSTPIVEDGEITGILSVARNITKEEDLKLKLVDKICDLNSLIEHKKQLEAQKELFMATLTHDLKNPVQAQLMSLKMLKNGTFGKLSKEQDDLLDILLESSEYMQNMLYSILKTYKYDNGIIVLQKDFINIEELMNKCIKEVSMLAKSREINIIFNSFINGKKIYADYEQLRRVIGNIINNALNHSYKISDFNIILKEENNKFVFIFTNKGKPISEEKKKKIFEKYYTDNQLNGIGLGLYFSKKVIEAHNGNIYLESNGELTSFIFELPISDDKHNSAINWE